VAVSSSMTKPLAILTSDDGLAWSPRSIPFRYPLNLVGVGRSIRRRPLVLVGLAAGNFPPYPGVRLRRWVTWSTLYDMPGDPA
jgi:hypothetical protein